MKPRLTVRTDRQMHFLTGCIVAAAVVTSVAAAYLLIELALPRDFPESKAFLMMMAYIITVTTCVVVALPFSYLAASSLLEAHRVQMRISTMALTDQLTGLPNRIAVIEQVEALVAGLAASGREGTVLFVDLDHFKTINDVHGHATGDAALRHAANVMSNALGPDAVLGRLGGEEFICFVDNADNAACVAGSLITALRSTPLLLNGTEVFVKASIGSANTGLDSHAAPVLARADQALYIAKASGRDCIVSYDQIAMLRGAAARLDVPQRRASDSKRDIVAAGLSAPHDASRGEKAA